MKRQATFRVSMLLMAAFSEIAHADCSTQSVDPRLMIRLTGDSIVKIQTLSSDSKCITNGTGFVVSESGHVLTASHVIPESCTDLSIVGMVAGNDTAFSLQLVERSALDAALLKFSAPPSDLPALSIGHPIAADEKEEQELFDLSDVVIVSFYQDQTKPVPTNARIDSVSLIGQPNLWALCAVAANPGRSGSPVMTSAGSVLAIFVEKPGGDSQDLARALPIHRIRDLPSLLADPPILSFGEVHYAGGNMLAPYERMALDFAFNDKENPSKEATSKRGRFLAYDGKLVSTQSMSDLNVIAKLAGGAQLKFAVRKERTINAPRGFVFDERAFTMRVSSLNPPYSDRPDKPCSDGQAWDCYVFSKDGRSFTLRYTMFAGPKFVDETRGWISSTITTQIVGE